jgi:lambda repressor-like predicted transcriptional regulator
MISQNPSQKRAAAGLSIDIKACLKMADELRLLLASGLNADGTLQPQTIKALLKFKSVELRSLAVTRECTEAYVHQVINRQRRDSRVEELIAIAIGLEPDQVWGRRIESGV